VRQAAQIEEKLPSNLKNVHMSLDAELGAAYYYQGRLTEALVQFKKALDLSEKSPDTDASSTAYYRKTAEDIQRKLDSE